MLVTTDKKAITLYRNAPKRMNKLSVHRTITIARANKATEIRYTPTIDTHIHPSDRKTYSEQRNEVPIDQVIHRAAKDSSTLS